MTNTSTTKRTTPAKAKASTADVAKAKAEASIKATAAAIVAEGLTAEAKVSDALAKSTSVAESLAAANVAAGYVAKAEADAFDAIVFGKVSISAAVYDAYKRAVTEADVNATPKEAEALSWTQVAAVALPKGMNTKETWEKATKDAPRRRPIQRAWSSLANDWSLFVTGGHGGWRAAYDLSLAGETPTIAGYATFCRNATAEAARVAGEKGTPQSRSAKTKAAAKALAETVAANVAKAEETRTKAIKDAAKSRMDHITTNPAASVVKNFSAMSGSDLTSCFDLDVLDALLATIKVWRDHVNAMTKEEREAAAALVPAAKSTVPSEATVEAVADVAKADEAEVPATDDVATIVAAVMAQMAAAK